MDAEGLRVKETRTTRHPWLVACDANMNPEDFKKSLWFKERCLFIGAPEEGSSTCRSRWLEGCLIASSPVEVCKAKSNIHLWWKTSNQDGTRQLVTFLVEREEEIQEVRELRAPKGLPGHSGGKMQGRSKAEGGKGEKEVEDEVRRVEKEVTKAVLTASPIESTSSGGVGDVVEEM